MHFNFMTMVYRVLSHKCINHVCSEATSISSRGIHMPAIKTSVEMGHRDAAMRLASAGHMPPTKLPISLWDLLDALQVGQVSLQ